MLDELGNKFHFTEEHLESLRNNKVLQEFYDWIFIIILFNLSNFT